MTLYINACPREESRTERLARAYLAHISDVTELNVYDQPLVPLDRKRLAHRESLIAGGKWHDPMFDYAHQFADADDIIIAAPYWDLGFPAQLKTCIREHLCPRHCQRLQRPRTVVRPVPRPQSDLHHHRRRRVRPAVQLRLSDRYGQRILRYPRDPTYLCGVSRHLRQRPRGYSAVRNRPNRKER